jgi:dihydroorotate dehydrogenase electron transfer subunit
VRQTTAICHQVELIGNRVRVHLHTDLILAPGQFALARLSDSFDPYLRQPLFPSLIEQTGFAVDITATDPALRLLSPGSTVDLLGPIGKPIPNLADRSRVLLIAETDPVTLLPFAARAIEAGGTATLLLSTRYPLDGLDPEIEVQFADPTQLPGQAADLSASADLILIDTSRPLHQPLHRALTDSRSFLASQFAYARLNSAMPCGLGACGACYIKTARGHKLACIDGPFFSLSEIEGS